MALDWLPVYPPWLPRSKARARFEPDERLNVLPIPLPAPPTELTWKGHYPDRLERRQIHPALTARAVAPIPATALLAPIVWKATYPDQVRGRALLVALQPTTTPFQMSSLIAVGITGAWRPIFPSWLARRVPVRIGTSVISPLFLLGPAACVEWTAETCTLPLLTAELVISPTITTETLIVPLLTEEDLC